LRLAPAFNASNDRLDMRAARCADPAAPLDFGISTAPDRQLRHAFGLRESQR
jgi:hypothetical protein